jgi:putative aldouronate transport system substrate-binding protein
MGREYRNWFPKIDGSFSCGNATGPGEQDEEAWASLTDYDRELFTKLGISSRIGFMGAATDVPPYYPYWAMRASLFANTGSPADLAWNRQGEFMSNNLPNLVVAPRGQWDNRLRSFRADLARIDMTPTIETMNAEIRRIMSLAN